MAFGSSRAQGVVRDNRFYHARPGHHVAFPRGWTIENQRDRCWPTRRRRTAFMQITVEPAPPNQGPREFLLIQQLRGAYRSPAASR